jgi:hypothetical protein
VNGVSDYFSRVDPWKLSGRPSVYAYVWCENERECKDLVSASASVSGGDSVAIASAVTLSVVSTIRGLQQHTPEAEPRTQDQVERSNAQTVTLPVLTHSYVRYACVNVV